ncbi:hypothetical protein DSC45_14420 [Streptomyces sp. YIM 130001]|uniref:hypothetical protein n=1 Tax=Streptomyces sp. YIM 130001 TaxID=2259644 RepID=UPI000E64C94C|nr:hypothetical protein [Streptomyces sp. YIM 130001]RII16954.1 hypothetical protein DSC45_14420 [Streptomyces sp. YIM 130001]
MEAIIASAVAVAGTLLGSAVTLMVQRRIAEQAHRFARDERLRQERLDAYSAYAGALVDYRRSLVHLWFCLHGQPPPEDASGARIRTFELRSQAQEALFRAQMLTDDVALGGAAADVLDLVADLYKVESRALLDGRRSASRDAIQQLVMDAKRVL